MASYDIKYLFSSPNRDFLIRNNGDQVKVDELRGKTIGLYFSASRFAECHHFTAKLLEDYNSLSPLGVFEVIFASADNDEESFNEYFSKMPWLAIPFSDRVTELNLNKLFVAQVLPRIVILNGSGEVLLQDGVSIMTEYGAAAHPYTPERLKYLKEEDEKARKEQTLANLLVSCYRNFLIANDGNQVPVSELEGKTVGLYFSSAYHSHCFEFTPKLVEVYNKLNESGENFKVVFVTLDSDDEVFESSLEEMPWLAVPCRDRSLNRLHNIFGVLEIPVLVIIGPDGKTLHRNVVDIIEDHGAQAYPFTPERLAELEEIDKAKLNEQTLESVLVQGDRDFVIQKDGTKIRVSDLVGKNILLYFSAHWCGPCRTFLPKLIEVYHEIKAKDDAFEVIYISNDYGESSFEENFSSMPWLALPLGDERKKSLCNKFKIRHIPMVVALGPSGRTVTKYGRDRIVAHGAKGYPFTDERIKEIEDEIQERATGLPERVRHALHEKHELVLVRGDEVTRGESYTCDGCGKRGKHWSFYCKECDFDLHPKCALGERVEGEKGKEENLEESSEKGSKRQRI